MVLLKFNKVIRKMIKSVFGFISMIFIFLNMPSIFLAQKNDCLENAEKVVATRGGHMSIVREYVKNHNLIEAEKFIDTFEKPEQKAEGLLIVARSYRKVQQLEKVNNLLRRIEEIAHTMIGSDHSRFFGDQILESIIEEYINISDLNNAERVANFLEVNDQLRALGKIVNNHLVIHNFFEVERIAHTISNDWGKNKVLEELVQMYLYEEKESEAERILASMPNGFHKTRTLCFMAIQHQKQQKTSEANDCLKKAEEMATDIGDFYEKTNAFKAMIKVYEAEECLDYNKVDNLLDIIAGFLDYGEGEVYYEQSLTYVIKKYFEIGKIDKTIHLLNKAEERAFTIQDSWDKSCSLIFVARQYLKIHNLDKTRDCLIEVEKTINAIDNKYSQDDLSSDLARVYTKMQDFKEARRVLSSVINLQDKDLRDRDYILVKIAAKCMKIGSATEAENFLIDAEKIADLMELGNWRCFTALNTVLKKRIKLQFVNNIDDLLTKTEAAARAQTEIEDIAKSLTQLASNYIRIQNFEKANDLLIEVEKCIIEAGFSMVEYKRERQEEERPEILAKIARSYIKMQNLKEAERVTERIEGKERDNNLGLIFWAYADAENLSEAKRIISKMKNSYLVSFLDDFMNDRLHPNIIAFLQDVRKDRLHSLFKDQ